MEEQKELILTLEDEKKHIINKKLEDEWQLCCSKSDRHCLMFLVQVAMGFITILFCMLKIATAQEGEDTSVYFGLLGSVIGVYLPNPSISKG